MREEMFSFDCVLKANGGNEHIHRPNEINHILKDGHHSDHHSHRHHSAHVECAEEPINK